MRFTGQRKDFKVGDKVRLIKSENNDYLIAMTSGQIQTVTTATHQGDERIDEWFIDTDYLAGGYFADRFELVETPIPTKPVKISSLPTEGMGLKDVLDRWEKLDAAGLIIKED